MDDRRGQGHLRGVQDDGVQLVGRWSGMCADLGYEGDVAFWSIDAVDHEIARARHPHQVCYALDDEGGVRPLANGPGSDSRS